MAFYDEILSVATSQDWTILGINLILSTIIGGIVIVILLAIAGRAFGEPVKLPNAFLMVLLINIINFFGILAFFPTLPFISLVVPVLVWIGFTKIFFSQMALTHILIVGIVGYVLSIFLIPNMVGYFSAFLPSFPAF